MNRKQNERTTPDKICIDCAPFFECASSKCCPEDQAPLKGKERNPEMLTVMRQTMNATVMRVPLKFFTMCAFGCQMAYPEVSNGLSRGVTQYSGYQGPLKGKEFQPLSHANKSADFVSNITAAGAGHREYDRPFWLKRLCVESAKKSLQNATPNEGGHLWCAFWVQSLTWRNIMHTVCCGSPNWSVDLTSNEKVQIQQGAKPSSAHRVSIISRTVAHSVYAECSSTIREV